MSTSEIKPLSSARLTGGQDRISDSVRPARPQFLSEQLYNEYRRFLHQRIGRNRTSDDWSFGQQVKQRVGALGLPDAADYLAFIQSDEPGAQHEVDTLIDGITCHITRFFRHPDQLETFRKIIKDIAANRRHEAFPALRLWSAGCATGEEAYTLAIVVRDSNFFYGNWNVSINATDVSKVAVDEGRRGVYTQSRIETVPEPYRSTYFRSADTVAGKFRVTEALRRMIDFGVLNLAERGEVERMTQMDVIFFRNVLPYFDLATRKSVVNALWRCLRPSGYLVLGPCDGIKNLGEIFSRTPHSGAILEQINPLSWLLLRHGE